MSLGHTPFQRNEGAAIAGSVDDELASATQDEATTAAPQQRRRGSDKPPLYRQETATYTPTEGVRQRETSRSMSTTSNNNSKGSSAATTATATESSRLLQRRTTEQFVAEDDVSHRVASTTLVNVSSTGREGRRREGSAGTAAEEGMDQQPPPPGLSSSPPEAQGTSIFEPTEAELRAAASWHNQTGHGAFGRSPDNNHAHHYPQFAYQPGPTEDEQYKKYMVSLQNVSSPLDGPRESELGHIQGAGGPKPQRRSAWFQTWLTRLKKYFLLVHYSYILTVALISSISLFLIELDYVDDSGKRTGVPFIDALFIAISSVSCTGMTTIDMTSFKPGSDVVWHVTMTLGGTVFTSAVAPMLRMLTLRKLLKEERELKQRGFSTYQRAIWGRKKRMYLRQLIVTSTILTVSTFAYWFAVQFFGFLFLLPENPARTAITRAISLFANCAFSSAVPQSRETYTLLVFFFLIPMGSALFPPFFRLFLMLERRLLYAFLSCCSKRELDLTSTFEPLPNLDRAQYYEPSRQASEAEQEALLGDRARRDSDLDSNLQPKVYAAGRRTNAAKPINGSGVGYALSQKGSAPDMLALSHTSMNGGGTMKNSASPPGSFRQLQDANSVPLAPLRNKWISGFNRILNSKQPGNHHGFLFVPSESIYLVVAWAFIVLVQLVPFLAQQWDVGSALGQFTPFQKVVVATVQTVGHRFAGLQLVDLDLLKPGHILLIIFALYVPMLPIPTDRSRRKWKEMMRAGVWRLLTSRFWWLFIAINALVFLEEDNIAFAAKVEYEINTRMIFEALSAYATAGLSLPLASQTNTSLSGCFHPVSKIIVMLLMLVGRHRGMDLGLDLGLTELATSVENDEEEVRILEAEAQAQGLLSVENVNALPRMDNDAESEAGDDDHHEIVRARLHQLQARGVADTASFGASSASPDPTGNALGSSVTGTTHEGLDGRTRESAYTNRSLESRDRSSFGSARGRGGGGQSPMHLQPLQMYQQQAKRSHLVGSAGGRAGGSRTEEDVSLSLGNSPVDQPLMLNTSNLSLGTTRSLVTSVAGRSVTAAKAEPKHRPPRAASATTRQECESIGSCCESDDARSSVEGSECDALPLPLPMVANGGVGRAGDTSLGGSSSIGGDTSRTQHHRTVTEELLET